MTKLPHLVSWLALCCIGAAAAAAQHAPPPYKAWSEDKRREQIMQWAIKPDAAACGKIQAGLTDPSGDIRMRAAGALYWKCDRSLTANSATQALCRSVELGNGHAGAWLLLGYAKPEEALPCLRKPPRKGAMVKLAISSKPLSAEFAARVALARLRDPAATAALRTTFEKPTLDEALFLLAALPDIEDAASLASAIKLLDDGVRQAPGPDFHTTRALRNVALEALVERFHLKPGFPLDPARRYSDSEIAEVRKAATGALLKD